MRGAGKWWAGRQDRQARVSFQPKGAGLLHGGQHLLIQHGEGRVGWQVQPVETGVSPAETTGGDIIHFLFTQGGVL